MRFSVLYLLSTAVLACSALLTGANARSEGRGMLLPATPADRVRADVVFLPTDEAALDRRPSQGETRLTITGAYSSGDRFAPEGFVIRRGDPSHPWPQRWDGLLLIDGAGRLSLHDVTRVEFEGERYDLRDRATRRRFLDKAISDRATALQSHLLINEGALDLKPVANAPRFRRRLLFQTADGAIGVYDTTPAAMTLYEAAVALKAEAAPRFALNLDMGNYDFCERWSGGARPERCGLLGRDGMQKLTNLLTLTVAP